MGKQYQVGNFPGTHFSSGLFPFCLSVSKILHALLLPRFQHDLLCGVKRNVDS